jgi:hypothetical protein
MSLWRFGDGPVCDPARVRPEFVEVEMRAETMVIVQIVVSSILEVAFVFEREFGV